MPTCVVSLMTAVGRKRGVGDDDMLSSLFF